MHLTEANQIDYGSRKIDWRVLAILALILAAIFVTHFYNYLL